ncbi:MAG: ABC transporter ATP-binding protein [Actinomycetales bacterium]
MLTISDLHVSYGPVKAVRGVSMSASPGEISLVLGANGAGKTTTLRAVCGLLSADSGTVTLDGTSVLGLPAHKVVRKGLAMVPEGRRIFAPLTVEENLRMGGYTTPRRIAGAVKEVYERFPILAERRAVAAGLLSGGEQQMLAFGRALMSGPAVIVMDEPSMGLAPAMVDRVFTSVRAIADTGIAVLMVEQNADAALRIADQVTVMSRGEVAHTGKADDMSANVALVHSLLGESALEGPATPDPLEK